MNIESIPQNLKNAGDVVAGSVVVASFFDMIQGGLELLGLLLAVLYGFVRLYETETAKKVLQWVRQRLSR